MGDENRKSGAGDGASDEGSGDFSDYFAEDDFFDDSVTEESPREPERKSAPEPEPETEPADQPEAEAAPDEPEPKPTAKPTAKPVTNPPKPPTAKPPTAKPPTAKPTGGARALLRYGLPAALFVLISIGAIFFSKPSGDELLTQATQSFGKIERGVFDFQIAITPKGQAGAQPSSIRLAGPFDLPPSAKLPNASIEYTISSAGQEQTQTLIFTGGKAYFEIQGQAYEMPPQAIKQLQAASKDLRKSNKGGSGLAGVNLNFDQWLSDPEVVNGGEVGGQKTWQVDAKVDVVKAMVDLVAQAKTLGTITGSQLPEQLSSQDAAELRKSIKRAFVRVNVGRYDKLLRRFDLTMDLVTPASGSKSTATSQLAGGRVNVVIAIDDPNQPVNVEPPPNPLPYSALESLTGAGAGASGQTGK